jgi:hypothetical protein
VSLFPNAPEPLSFLLFSFFFFFVADRLEPNPRFRVMWDSSYFSVTKKRRKEKKIKLSTLEKKRNLFNINYFFKES